MYRIGIIVTFIIVFAGCGHVQNIEDEDLLNQFRQGIERGEVELGGEEPENVSEPAQIINMDELDERYVCAGQRWRRYYIGDTGISFCYDMAWGDPILDEIDARRGLYGSVTFESNRFYDEVSYRPSVWFEIVDLVREDSDVPQVRFHRAYSETSHELLKQYFNLEESAVLEPATVDGKSAWRASNIEPIIFGLEPDEDAQTRVGYYIPFASREYHVQTGAQTSEVGHLDFLMESMRFDDK